MVEVGGQAGVRSTAHLSKLLRGGRAGHTYHIGGIGKADTQQCPPFSLIKSQREYL